jgi:phosphomannomutase/phosphoglucomutase
VTQYRINTHITQDIFRAYDIRGVVDDSFTPDNVYTIGRAIGSEAISRGLTKIVIARDGRLSGPTLIKALAQGLMDSGCHVIDIGAVPTPVLYFATYVLETGSGVMLTGSHNPANYNGLKMMLGYETLAEEVIQDLYWRIEEEQFHNGQGSYEELDISEIYLKRITQDVKLARPLKIVVDAGNGIAGSLAPQLYRALGCEVVELYCEVDGHFPNHHPDPSKEKNLHDLIEQVRAIKADLGLAFDGDGDRLGVVTDQGEIIAADRQMMLYATDVLSRHAQATIIYDVKCSEILKDVIVQHGGQPLMWKTGHSLIKAKMKEIDVPLAGEMSGHIFFKERWYGFDDALYTGARLLEIVAKQSLPVSQLFDQFPKMAATPEINVPMADELKFDFVSRLQQEATFNNANINTIDGLRVSFPEGWGLVRCSNTTPCLVLRFEAQTEAALKNIQQLFKEQMLRFNPDLDLTF